MTAAAHKTNYLAFKYLVRHLGPAQTQRMTRFSRTEPAGSPQRTSLGPREETQNPAEGTGNTPSTAHAVRLMLS